MSSTTCRRCLMWVLKMMQPLVKQRAKLHIYITLLRIPKEAVCQLRPGPCDWKYPSVSLSNGNWNRWHPYHFRKKNRCMERSIAQDNVHCLLWKHIDFYFLDEIAILPWQWHVSESTDKKAYQKENVFLLNGLAILLSFLLFWRQYRCEEMWTLFVQCFWRIYFPLRHRQSLRP